MPLNFESKQQDLKENELSIVLLSANRIDKLNKTVVNYAMQKNSLGEFEKGYSIVKQAWFDKFDMFNKFKVEDFGKVCKAKFKFKLLNNGHADIEILDICI